MPIYKPREPKELKLALPLVALSLVFYGSGVYALSSYEAVNDDDNKITYNNDYLRTGEAKEFDAFEHIVCVNEKNKTNYEGYDISFKYDNKTMIVNTAPVIVTEYVDSNGNIEYPYPGRVKILDETNQKTKKLSS